MVIREDVPVRHNDTVPALFDPPRQSGPVVIGTVLRSSPRFRGVEPFYAEFIAGLEDTLRVTNGSVLVHIADSLDDEIASYRRWAASGHVSAIVVHDLTENDARTSILHDLGLPALVLGDPLHTSKTGVATLEVDNFEAVTLAVHYAVELGHHRIGRVAGPAQLVHTGVRSSSFAQAITANGATAQTVTGDYSEQSGFDGTRELLSGPERPTMILFDNDLMALGGLAYARQAGLAVPAELSLLAWDDSSLCRLSTPPLSVMRRDVHWLGAAAAEMVRELLAGRAPGTIPAPAPQVVARGTTAPPPAG
ncbi:LacI family DNA-binding transcriptional regulator [Cryobacterium sp.]|jgi:DNA-binding LacI/PurR family transcriptional regulator|uniref:LacI family DNA-binding transcriptional regulator n=1 Tax=Cryobacterium sp. TaxID=1926290 RepID=UPI0026347BA2|nr:LacI family DNA-binding transcriptional regulator [Cryobacterium sp.]MCU1444353.1 LacI family transcriptional regulator [Cryobacterium sp.]